MITAQCIRVPVSDGHMAAVFVAFERKPTREQILVGVEGVRRQAAAARRCRARRKPFLHYFEDDTRPQTRLDRDAGNGQAITIGRLRPDTGVRLALRRAVAQHGSRRGRWCGPDRRAARERGLS